LQKDLFFIDSIKKETNFSNFVNSKSIFDYHNSKKNGFQDLSISFERQRNEKLPFGYNDGSLFPSRGKQERTTFGISFITQNIDLRYQPEIIYAENIDQEPFLGYTADGNWWARYYLMIGNTIDNFNRFTKDKIKNFNLGQSRLGLKNKYLLFGLSTENIWWGPGLRNSIMFTNNSPGFEHIYISLPKPLNTAIGSFEFYYINGKLRNYNYVNPDNDIMNNIWSDGIYPKKQKDRNISAYNIVYNPRFLKNFYISYSYSNQFYYNDSNAFNIKYSKFSLDKPKYNLGTLAFKFKLPKNNAEFYAEIGQQYLPPNPIYFFTDSNRVAYIIGVDNYIVYLKIFI
jgi:hypothetical protein